jgi:hypothetical protein
VVSNGGLFYRSCDMGHVGHCMFIVWQGGMEGRRGESGTLGYVFDEMDEADASNGMRSSMVWVMSVSRVNGKRACGGWQASTW